MSIAYLDEVQNIDNEYAGTVITIYVEDGITYLDVRCGDHVYYDTPASGWRTTVAYVE